MTDVTFLPGGHLGEPTASGGALIVETLGRRVGPLPLHQGIPTLGRQTRAQATATASNDHE